MKRRTGSMLCLEKKKPTKAKGSILLIESQRQSSPNVLCSLRRQHKRSVRQGQQPAEPAAQRWPVVPTIRAVSTLGVREA